MVRQEEKAVVKVLRSRRKDGERDPYQSYEIPHGEKTVLQVLEEIYETQDPTLAFRYGCGGSGPARCGACVMEVNGLPVLACRKQAEKAMVLNPHHKFKVIKDLVIDFERGGNKG
jgi:succinate dehydrogenase/fumarate reductase-like Fe-S protein